MQTSGVDFTEIGVAVAVLIVGVIGMTALVKFGINMKPRARKPSRVRKAKGEYQPPEPPEGRYWG